MAYHYLTFAGKNPPLQWEIAGLYSVAMFYILSGLTIYLVYNKDFHLKSFFIRRFFRIFPLLWLVTTLAIILSQSLPSIELLILNYTGLFGFINPSAYISTGVWSIGNELVFYALFPILFYLRNHWLYWVLFFALAGVFIYFTFFLLDKDLRQVWGLYVNPLNHALYFAIGITMGVMFKENVNKWVAALFFILGLFIFLWPDGEAAIDYVSGWTRIILSMGVVMICFAFYKINLPHFKFLSLIGNASYSIYLLHPLVWNVVGYFTKGDIQIFTSITLTLVSSYYVYVYFEKYFMKMGKRHTT